MQNTRYDFSSVHVDVPSPLSEEIVKWGRENVSDDDIYVSPKDPGFGREDEIHITILYGIHAAQPDQVESLLKGAGPIKVRLGKLEVFANPFKFDVLMIDVQSEDLDRINQLLQKDVKFTNKYPVYQPHVTIAYVQKGKGWQHRGEEIWEGREFVCDYTVFSSKEGFKHRIPL